MADIDAPTSMPRLMRRLKDYFINNVENMA